MTTIKERVEQALNNLNCDVDDVNKVIALAYYMGRESATKEVSDDYTALIRAMRQRADECRYNRMAHGIIGTKNYIYHGDYDQAMTNTFGNDETNI